MEWIKCRERMPEQAKRVLVWGIYYNAKCVMVACLQRQKWLIEGMFSDATITHWMPLPEPPSEEGQHAHADEL